MQSKTKLLLWGLPLLMAMIVAMFAHVIAPFDADQIGDSNGLFEFKAGPSSKHLLGTNEIGMDVFSRLIFGAQTAISVAMCVAICAFVIGVFAGTFAGVASKQIDATLRYLSDLAFALPGLLLAIALSFVLSQGRPDYWSTVTAVIIAETLNFSTRHFYLIRSGVREKIGELYVTAARASGGSAAYLALRHILPGVLQQNMPLVVQSGSSAVATLAGLGFLGLGIGYGSGAEWGFDLSQSVNLLLSGNPLPFAVFSGALVFLFSWLAFWAEKATSKI